MKKYLAQKPKNELPSRETLVRPRQACRPGVGGQPRGLLVASTPGRTCAHPQPLQLRVRRKEPAMGKKAESSPIRLLLKEKK